jgi:hypothetical protein
MCHHIRSLQEGHKELDEQRNKKLWESVLDVKYVKDFLHEPLAKIMKQLLQSYRNHVKGAT